MIKVPKTISYNLGKGIVNTYVNISKALGEAARYVKKEPFCVTYPLLGNMSQPLQERLETLTKGKYNAENATATNIAVNQIAYSIASFGILIMYHTNTGERDLNSINDLTNDINTVGPFVVQFVLANAPMIYETFKRDCWLSGYPSSEKDSELRKEGKKLEKKVSGSSVGKIASLPLEVILGVYDEIKKKDE